MYLKKIVLSSFAITILAFSTSFSQTIFTNSFSLTTGFYAASGFGTNAHLGLNYNHFMERGKYFVEAGIGYGSIKSEVLSDLLKAQVFETENLVTYKVLFGYDYMRTSSWPYLVVGLAGVNQGGQTNFAGVLGIGKRMSASGVFGSNRFGFRYDIRDQIFNQKLNNASSFTSHNLVLQIGIEYFY